MGKELFNKENFKMILSYKNSQQITSKKSVIVEKPMFAALHDIVILLTIWDISTEEQKLVLEKFLLLSGVCLLEGLSNTLQYLVNQDDTKIILRTVKEELKKVDLKAPEWIKKLSALLFLRKKDISILMRKYVNLF